MRRIFTDPHLPTPCLQRRSYLVLCGLLGAVVWVMLGTFPPSLFILQASIFFEAIASAFSDVVVDSMVVTRARDAAARCAAQSQLNCSTARRGGVILAIRPMRRR